MSTAPVPQPEKSRAQLQADLAKEILEVLDLEPVQIEPEDYNKIRAAIAHYTVTLFEK